MIGLSSVTSDSTTSRAAGSCFKASRDEHAANVVGQNHGPGVKPRRSQPPTAAITRINGDKGLGRSTWR